MSLLRQFPHSRKYPPLPDIFPSPFADVPHALAQQAAMLLQQELSTQAPSEHDFHARDSGKMMGVLVVQGEAGELGYLQGFSGKLAGKWQLPGFVPPIFDAEALDKFLPQGEQRLAQLTQEIIAVADGHDYISACEKVAEIKFSGEQAANALRLTLIAKKAKRKAERESLKERLEQGEQATALARLSQESQDDRREKQAMKKKCAFQLQQAQATLTPFEVRLESLETQRTVLSKTLHAEIFSHYQLLSTNQEHKPMSSFYMDHSPPGGSGDCAAPKLIQYANNVGLKPLALAEFWWGAAPAGGVRHHGVFYASCRGKCRPILPFMLKGLDIAPEPQPFLVSKTQSLDIVFEDEYLVVINKPVGLLSVPGGEVDDSAYSRLRHRYPKATGPLVVHRLDLATSGLLLAAKTSKVHKHLQQQFIHRQIKKRYVAVLAGNLAGDTGTVELPLRVDISDRPRQLVCPLWGKSARTDWRVISRNKEITRVYFYPHTGRTHQLRVHASHRDGLSMPIVGDALYGTATNRLMLHAERLIFSHPGTGEMITLCSKPPF